MTATADPHVTVAGERPVRIPVPLPPDHDHETATVEGSFRCSGGDLIAEGWTGLAVGPLLLAADVPAETTHVQVEGTDGFTVCVPIGAALDGVLAFEDQGTETDADPSADADWNPDADPRFAAPGISGTRTVKGVRRLRPVALDPGDHPEDWEDLLL